jgi:hypothetical protein
MNVSISKDSSLWPVLAVAAAFVFVGAVVLLDPPPWPRSSTRPPSPSSV